MDRMIRAQPFSDVIAEPQILHNGKLFEDVMAKAQLTHHELNAALRRSGCSSVADVHSAILENNGAISVVAMKDKEAS